MTQDEFEGRREYFINQLTGMFSRDQLDLAGYEDAVARVQEAEDGLQLQDMARVYGIDLGMSRQHTAPTERRPAPDAWVGRTPGQDPQDPTRASRRDVEDERRPAPDAWASRRDVEDERRPAPDMDLPSTYGASLPVADLSGERHGAQLINFGKYPPRMDQIAIFSSSDIQGRVNLAPRISSIAIFGGVRLDLRKAQFPPGETVIDVVAIFGGVDVILPRGVNYAVHGFGIMGGFSGPRGRSHEYDQPDAPLVRIQGVAVFGGANVQVRRGD